MKLQNIIRRLLLGVPKSEISVPPAAHEAPTSHIVEKTQPGHEPQFTRVYTAQLNECAHITVTMCNHPWFVRKAQRYASGELKQPDVKLPAGRSVSFDPRAIADKIIDPLLTPLLQRHVDEIFRLDAEFMRTEAGQFTDETGQVWVKLKARSSGPQSS
jgi:hypothetical protein